MKQKLFLFLIALSLLAGCDIRQREEALQNKETELSRREQELAMKERTLSLKEDELVKREQKLDSVLALDSTLSDSAIVYDSTMIGPWSVKMTCTETTCPGSAVGDTKSETWDFYYINDRLFAKAMEGTEIVRLYAGAHAKDGITLSVDVPSTPSRPATKISVRLVVTNANTMEGQREIARDNDCKIIYALQLSKQ
jgi:hypothetical protein